MIDYKSQQVRRNQCCIVELFRPVIQAELCVGSGIFSTVINISFHEKKGDRGLKIAPLKRSRLKKIPYHI